MQREQMAFDVVIVGAGPAGLSAACRLKQQAPELSVCVLEKGAAVGSHILSGALFDPIALDELFPDWQQRQVPIGLPVSEDQVLYLGKQRTTRLPNWTIPKGLHNQGSYILSLGAMCQWLAEQAANLGVEIFTGFAAQQICFDPEDRVTGVITGDMGVDRDGQPKAEYMPGIELKASATLFAEGSRGHLGKQLIAHYQLDRGKTAQHYALGFKEIWRVDACQHHPGRVQHTFGMPLSNQASGGGFVYHAEDDQLFVGLVIDLNYRDPHLDPFQEFQAFKRHPAIASQLQGGERLSYGARSLTKGGWSSLPEMAFPGGLLIGCDAGTLDNSRLKGSHCAMKSGMLAADQIAEQLTEETTESASNIAFSSRLQGSWLGRDLIRARNATAHIHRFGNLIGGGLNWLEQSLLGYRPLWNCRDEQPDFGSLQPSRTGQQKSYQAPDRQLSFDRPSSLFLANIAHEEDQPCHLTLRNKDIPIQQNLAQYDEPAQRYCPAGVYEIIQVEGHPQLQINAQNCLHCKCCDIKDPAQNINWIAPEGGSGPNYVNM